MIPDREPLFLWGALDASVAWFDLLPYIHQHQVDLYRYYSSIILSRSSLYSYSTRTMPRQKRALSKVDPNSRSNTPKETSSGKRRATSATKSTMETSSLNDTASTPVPQESSSGKGKATCTTRSTTETSSSNAASNAHSNQRDDINAAAPKFIGLPRPFWDIEEEVPYDEDDEDDEDDESQSRDVEDTEAPKAPHDQDKNAAERESPDWLWVMSELAVDKYRQLVEQARKRDQDEHDLHIYNDFSAYGINEVVDNWVR